MQSATTSLSAPCPAGGAASAWEATHPVETIAAAHRQFGASLCLISSFGTEAVVLLHMVARVDAALAVLFVDTGKLFAQTTAYAEATVAHLGLTNLQLVRPSDEQIEISDPRSSLWRDNPDVCCTIRKVNPLATALSPFRAWMTGRRRGHGGERTCIPQIEVIEDRIRINPLAAWTHTQVEDYIADHNLPRHPLVEGGYRSVGCWPCTARGSDATDIRSGRWPGRAKAECGIHHALREKRALENYE